MEIEIITGIIANTGFPIACVIIMFKMLAKERADTREDNERWIEAINNNTTVIERLIGKVEGK